MKKLPRAFITAAVALAAWASPLTPACASQTGLSGTWTEAAQGNTIEIAPCAESADLLCVRLLADRPERGEKSRAGAVVARHLATTAPSQWRGEFLSTAGERFPIHITLAGADRFSYKVCALPGLCDGGSYVRVAP